MVEYRTLSNFTNYKFGDDGSAWTNKQSGYYPQIGWKRMRCTPDKQGRPMVGLYSTNLKKTQRLLVSRIILTIFIGSPPHNKPLALHKDGIPHNNFPNNLYWGNHRDNSLDSKRHGTFATGEKMPHAKLNPEKIREIKTLLQLGKIPLRRIAMKFKITHATIQQIRDGELWVHITGGPIKTGYPKNRHKAAKLTVPQVRKIKRLISKGLTDVFIANKFPVTRLAIRNIRIGKSWKHIM